MGWKRRIGKVIGKKSVEEQLVRDRKEILRGIGKEVEETEPKKIAGWMKIIEGINKTGPSIGFDSEEMHIVHKALFHPHFMIRRQAMKIYAEICKRRDREEEIKTVIKTLKRIEREDSSALVRLSATKYIFELQNLLKQGKK